MYPCYIITDRGIRCSKECDPFVRPAHLCGATKKNIYDDHARVVVKKMGAAIRFYVDNEVVNVSLGKKPDVELVDPNVERLTINLDTTLPIISRTAVFKSARRAKKTLCA